MIPAYATILGPVFGYLLARWIPDETRWYPNHFLAGALVLGVTSVFYTDDVWLAIALAGALVYALTQLRTWLVALCAGLLAAHATLIGQQLLLVALIPATGFLYHHGQRRELLWFALMPIVITASALL